MTFLVFSWPPKPLQLYEVFFNSAITYTYIGIRSWDMEGADAVAWAKPEMGSGTEASPSHRTVWPTV